MTLPHRQREFDYFKWRDLLLELRQARKLSFQGYVVAEVMQQATTHGTGRHCTLGIPEIARRAGMGKSTADKYVAELRDLRVIHQDRHGGGSAGHGTESATYHMSMPTEQSTDLTDLTSEVNSESNHSLTDLTSEVCTESTQSLTDLTTDLRSEVLPRGPRVTGRSPLAPPEPAPARVAATPDLRSLDGDHSDPPDTAGPTGPSRNDMAALGDQPQGGRVREAEPGTETEDGGPELCPCCGDTMEMRQWLDLDNHGRMTHLGCLEDGDCA